VATKTVPLGREGDHIYAQADRGHALNTLLGKVDASLGPEQTLLMLPEGVLVNYLSRRASSTRYFNFVPADIVMFGEQEMLSALEAQPADFVALVANSAGDYGLTGFGIDYGMQLADWVKRNSRQFGTPPEEGGFPILLLVRKSATNQDVQRPTPSAPLDKGKQP
jgi:hypothetical protein